MGAIWHGFTGLIQAIFIVFYHWTGNYVIGIVLLTLLVRLVLLPLGVAQARSMQKMARLAPKQRELQQKHKGNPQVLNQEISKMYKEEGVNPASGCLPLLLQIPVMYGLFDVLRTFHYRQSGGLWIWHNLAQPDHTFVLPILVAISTFFMQRQTMQMTPSQPGMESSQKMMLYMMPLVFGYVAYRFPAGLSIYYVVSNVFQWVQTIVLLRRPINGGAAGSAPATQK
ncbi:YidC/Oxa1 family membrane protein insertase [Sulfobacillus harzensis]|uniref:Membrane protein insertase YidC n=1 Tax=Sulfobacillus harzensis TaxID=2729629 RepID=A0A7Y0L0E4_9FIRM|nr:YidC/Oxa1 family membrane protein insertase [Sulfobacillus harzensis]NMP20920.1 membrane protein insertase YidC [Sulfobacillus harzensis]